MHVNNISAEIKEIKKKKEKKRGKKEKHLSLQIHAIQE